MIRLYKYVFCRYMRYYFRVDGDKGLSIFAGVILMSATNWFLLMSISILVFNNIIFISGDVNDLWFKAKIVISMISLSIINYVYLIKVNKLDTKYNEVIEEFENKSTWHNILFYGYYFCILLFFIVSIILSSIIYHN